MQRGLKRLFILVITLIALISILMTELVNLRNVDQESVVAISAEEDVTNNFLSRSTVKYDNINGKTVTVDTFYRDVDEVYNNPNVAQAIMIKQCMDYKTKYPNKEVYITLTSFHLSIVASVCIDSNSSEYGKMKSLYDVEYDSDGYYRISYLLVESAKLGINVIVIGQLDGSAVKQNSGYVADINHTKYFNSHMEDDCYIADKKVKDFMIAKTTEWTSYGDKAGTDMMHLKSCTVSNYIDADGVEHGSAVWFGSTNLDGIDMYGSNGNDSIQTGVVISDHEDIRRVTWNYTKLMSQYCGQEEINIFRDKIVNMNTEQILLINNGQEDQIAEEDQIVYLGSETDKVFEMYFSTFGGGYGNWDTVMNPYSKYISKLLPIVSGDDYIEFMWNNVKFVTTFAFAQTLEDVLQYSFTMNNNLNNKFYLRVPGINTTKFTELVEGENIGICSVNETSIANHAKDLQLSYVENGVRYYVSFLNSLNFHLGAMYGQSNTVLIIKETKETGNNFYTDFGKLTVSDIDFEAGRINN